MDRRTFLASGAALLVPVIGPVAGAPAAKPNDFVNGTWGQLFYPPVGYKYFDGAFADFTKFTDQSKAQWMVDAAVLAYAQSGMASLSAQELQDAYAAGGFRGKPEQLDDSNGTHAFFAQNDQCAVISFRGTQRGSWRNIHTLIDGSKNDLSDAFSLVPVPAGSFAPGVLLAFVPAGFKTTVGKTSVWNKINNWIEASKGKEIFLTGHSLGGALATLAAARASVPTNLYTFGCPAVGDQPFCDFVTRKVKTWRRYVDRGDAVTRVPTPPVFVQGSPATRVNVSADHPDPPLPDILRAFLQVAKVTDANLGEKIPDQYWFLADHSPSRYIYYVWNQ